MHFLGPLDLKLAVIWRRNGEYVVVCMTLWVVFFFPFLQVLSSELLAFHGVCTASTATVTCGSLSSIC